MNVNRVSTMVGGRGSIEIGKLAKQAPARTRTLRRHRSSGDACAIKEQGRIDFSLTVDYRENFYTVGKIPGGFFKREANLPNEVLNSRMIDRPIRPYFGRVQKRNTGCPGVVRGHRRIDPSMHAIVEHRRPTSSIPFTQPIAAVRVD
jgi:polyribonucleotide nucleotidyltransferase